MGMTRWLKLNTYILENEHKTENRNECGCQEPQDGAMGLGGFANASPLPRGLVAENCRWLAPSPWLVEAVPSTHGSKA
jgi:hypothetical protein